MSTYDDSSLFLYPSGYKASVLFAQKPMDANGQLAFTRSNNTATRVASNGLIERVRTNLLVQSNTFSTTWFPTSASVTSGQAGYDGTNNAWLLSKSAANGNIAQSPASSGSETISIYAKAGTDNWLHILVRDTALVFFGGYFDLQNGVVGSAVGATTLKIESVGNGWYRCSASFVKSTTNFYRIYPAEGNNDTSGTSGNILIQAAQLETGDIATQPILTTTAAVSVGPVANIPRIDYLGGGCGKLLLEPQRTNLLQFSEQFDNAYYSKNDSTITANDGISPDGFQSADKVTLTTTAGRVQRSVTLTADTQFTLSVFVKDINATNSRVGILCFNNANTLCAAQFTLTGNGSIFSQTNSVGSITPFGNGWYRCAITFNSQSGGTTPIVRVITNATGVGFTNGESVLIYGAQLEQGSYPSSYVPTLAASVTRGVDACSKTGISSLIGQTEGTLFLDVVAQVDTAESQDFSISDGTANNRASIRLNNSGLINAVGVFGGSVQFSMGTGAYVTGQRYKIALAYKLNDVVLYVNGVQSATDTSATISGTLSRVGFDVNTAGTQNVKSRVNQAIVFTTRLPNTELAALTTL